MPPARVLLWAATCGALAVALRAILGKPPPTMVAIALVVAYVALFMCGVLFLRLRMFVDAIVRGPKGARGVALTFDDGPHPTHTRKVLDALDARKVKATFFLVAKKAEKHADLAREIASRGHAIGLHSYEHARLMSTWSAARMRRDLDKGIAALEKLTGVRPTMYRPPIGHTNPSLARVVDDLDLTVVGWTVSGHDGLASAQAERVSTRVIDALADGVIVALHDAAEEGDREPAGVAALPDVLRAIEEAKLEVVLVETWLSSSTEAG